jgi:hypothetical protein
MTEYLRERIRKRNYFLLSCLKSIPECQREREVETLVLTT